MAAYIREYFRKYSGRGIPEVIDVVLATGVTGQRESSGGVSDEKLKEVAAMAKAAKNEVADLKREISSLKLEIRRHPKGPGAGDKEPRGPQCHTCGLWRVQAHRPQLHGQGQEGIHSDEDEAKGSDE